MNLRVWVFGVLFLSTCGCAHFSTRMQAEDETEKDKAADIKTLRDFTDSIANADSIAVSGVGLVVGLEGTGGGAPPGIYRQMLENDLRKRGAQNIKAALASPNTALVLVTAQIPPASRKGDRLDVHVTVPRESKVTSLRGGRLLECVLFNYNNKKNLDPNYAGADTTLVGHPLAKAEGNLIVGFGNGGEDEKLREAQIWSGARCAIDRPLFLILKPGSQYAQLAKMIAEAINSTFHGSFRGPATDLAVAKTKAVVSLGVPSHYRLNLPRYLRVVRFVPLEDGPELRIAYLRKLEKQLLDPAQTVTAALRLEALGKESEPVLRHGLKSEHPLVRFTSAESLAYLGNPGCGEELAKLIRQQPALRAYCLTALASFDEAISHVELARLLREPSAVTRYGAFRALTALDESADVVRGELLNESFWLHHTAPGSPSLIHLSSSRRAEIVLFGDEAALVPPFPILAGDFTVTANKGDSVCTVTRVSRRGKAKRQCPLKLEDVLRTLAEMGGTYAEAVEVLRKADRLQCLSCPLAIDALPQAVSVETLAKAGAGDLETLQTHPDIIDARGDMTSTPTLFEQSSNSQRPSQAKAAEPGLPDTSPQKTNGQKLERIHGLE